MSEAEHKPACFDEAAFDSAVSKPNGWSNVADPVAEIRRMRGDASPGNASALREALERIRPLVRATGATPYVPERKELVDGALAIIDAALAEPARNCDRFATVEEAVAAFADHLRAWENAHGICSEYPDHAVKVPAGAFAWLFATAQEGGDHA